jgi:hypothetical protein
LAAPLQARNWRGQPCWGRFLHVDFNVLCAIANEEFAKFNTRQSQGAPVTQ